MTLDIPLNRGKSTTVCDCHAHLVQKGQKWRIARSNSNTIPMLQISGVASYDVEFAITRLMHRVIMESEIDRICDETNIDESEVLVIHLNGDVLDNRCENLKTKIKKTAKVTHQ